MHVWLSAVVVALSLVALATTLVLLVRDEPAQDRTFGLLAAVEVALVVQAVLGCVALAGTTRDVSGVTFVAYLFAVLLALPVGAFWSLAERSRAGTGVLVVAVLTVVGLQARLHTIWGGGA